MSKLIAIGEALIDFIPKQKGIPLKDVKEFERVAGGAPANVAACVAKLGKEAIMLTKLGEDAFGEHLIELLNQANVNTNYIVRTNEANTALAFVSLKTNGERDFSFYRNPSADMLLDETEISESVFNEGDVLHFCSVDLVDAPVKKAHRKAIELCLKNNGIISFDPNVRLPLWKDPLDCKRVIREFIPSAHILKISDEELTFITGIKEENQAIQWLFQGNVKLVIYTKGADGSVLYTKDQSIKSKGFKIDVADTTGAGDSFIGSFIYQILQRNINVNDLDKNLSIYEDISMFSNAVGAIVASRYGAIPSMPSLDEVSEFINRVMNN